MKNQQDLTTKFNSAIKKFKQILYLQFQFLDPDSNMKKIIAQVDDKFKQIVQNAASADEQYSAILSWCNKWDASGDRFGLAKMKFKQFNDKEFHDYIALLKHHQSALCASIKRDHERKWHEQEREQRELNELIAKKQQEQQALEKIAQGLIDVQFAANCPDVVYQNNVRRLKRTCGLMKHIPAVSDLHLAMQKPQHYLVDVGEEIQGRALSYMGSFIRTYEETLAGRSLWRRFVDWFSFSHHRCVAAVENYRQTVQSQTDVHHRFAAAQDWYHAHKHLGKDNNTFTQQCMRPFKQELEQARFESVPHLQAKTQKEINGLVAVHTNSVASHHQRLGLLHKDLKSAHAKAAQLQTALKDTAATVSQIEEAGVFGFVRNKAAAVVNKIKGLFGFMSTPKDKAMDTAKEVVREFEQITPVTPVKKVSELSKKAAAVAKDPAAASVVQEGVNKVIHDTMQYGGKANNYCFMGATKAAELVSQIGSDKQKAVFKKAKAEADKEAQLTYANWEESHVAELDKKVETGEIHSQLNVWRDAMLRHNRAEGRQPTVNSERLYAQEVKAAAKKAFLFHSKGKKKLEAFITRTISAALAASQYDLKGKQMARGLQTLSCEQSDTLIRVYGTKQQIKHWNTEVLPRVMAAYIGPSVAALRVSC